MVDYTLPFMALTGAALAFGFIISIAAYLYFAFAFVTIAKKLKYDKSWLGWIPLVNFALFPILAKGKQRAWPWVFILLVPIVNIVFYIIWHWKIYEKRKYPGALSLIMLAGIVPFLGGFAMIAHYVVWGLVAWVDR